jgi:hypothetical protein
MPAQNKKLTRDGWSFNFFKIQFLFLVAVLNKTRKSQHGTIGL